MGELQQVLGKLMATAGDTKHWSGDLRKMLLEEVGDVYAALLFFKEMNLSHDEAEVAFLRAFQKLALFKQWHAEPSKP